jgi:hypothetical protein
MLAHVPDGVPRVRGYGKAQRLLAAFSGRIVPPSARDAICVNGTREVRAWPKVKENQVKENLSGTTS